MLDNNFAVPAQEEGQPVQAGQETRSGSAPEKSSDSQSKSQNVTEDEKMSDEDKKAGGDQTAEKTDQEDSDDSQEEEQSDDSSDDEKDKENEPRIPKRRLDQVLRRQKKTERENSEMREMLQTLEPMIKEIRAKQNGEEYDPSQDESKSSEKSIDPKDVFDDEFDQLADKMEKDGSPLSDSDYTTLEKLAEKYKYKVGEQEVYLPAETIYQIAVDNGQLGGGQKSTASKSKARKPSTGKSAKEDVGNVLQEQLKGAKSLDEITARALKFAQSQKSSGGK